MERKLLLQESEFSIWRHLEIPHAAKLFIEEVSWGNEGAVYEHKNTGEHIEHLKRPVLVSIEKQDRMVGTAVFCNTNVAVGGSQYNCYYIRYFAASKEIRGKGVIKNAAIKVMQLIRKDENVKTIYIGVVEKGNRASYRTVEGAGYTLVGRMKTNGFSRLFPKIRREIERVTTPEVRGEVLRLLRGLYAQHSMVQFDYVFLKDNYYVIRHQNEIVAGCQYHRAHWVVNRMPGMMGAVIMKVVPVMPLLNKLFNPRRFEFLGFEGIYVKPGYEKWLADLFEALLVMENVRSALYWMGEKCPVRDLIRKNTKSGLLDSFVRDSDALIMGAYHDMSETEIADFLSRPLYGSAYDYT